MSYGLTMALMELQVIQTIENPRVSTVTVARGVKAPPCNCRMD